MSLYRQTGGRDPRALVVALVVGLLIGLLGGYAFGRGSVEEPSAAEVVADARAELQPVAAGLELVPIEYEGALRNGKIAAPTEYEAAQGAVERTELMLEASAEDLQAIDAAGYEAAQRAVAQLNAAIDSTAPASDIEALSAQASTAVESLAGASK